MSNKAEFRTNDLMTSRSLPFMLMATIVVGSSVGFIASAEPAYAQCAPSTLPPAGANVVCSGAISGIYEVNEPDVTFINNGDWSYDGSAVTGVYTSGYLIGSDVDRNVVINNGTFTWTNAQVSQPDGTRAGIMVGYYNITLASEMSFRNSETGIINVQVADTPAGTGLAGVAVGAFADAGRASFMNEGLIEVSGALSTSGAFISGLDIGGIDVDVLNTGTIEVIESGAGSAYGIGMYAFALTPDPAFEFNLENSGRISVVSAGTFGAGAGLFNFEDLADPVTANWSNSGLIEIGGAASGAFTTTGPNPTADRAAVYFSAASDSELSFKIVNEEGGIIRANDDSSFALLLTGSDDEESDVEIHNFGEMIGGIRTKAGADELLLGDGSLTTGQVTLGLGSDTITLQGDADIMSVSLLDGDDFETTNIDDVDALSFSGWSGAIDGAQIANMETVHLTGQPEPNINAPLTINSPLAP